MNKNTNVYLCLCPSNSYKPVQIWKIKKKKAEEINIFSQEDRKIKKEKLFSYLF